MCCLKQITQIVRLKLLERENLLLFKRGKTKIDMLAIGINYILGIHSLNFIVKKWLILYNNIKNIV